jgi:hypothetical protein
MPSENPFYFQVERPILSLTNSLASDTVATAENSFTAVLVAPETVARNAMFPPSFLRAEALNMERLIIGRYALPTAIHAGRMAVGG